MNNKSDKSDKSNKSDNATVISTPNSISPAARNYMMKNKAAAEESLNVNRNIHRPIEERIRNYKKRNYERALISLRDERMRIGVPINAPYPSTGGARTRSRSRNSHRLLRTTRRSRKLLTRRRSSRRRSAH